MAEKSLLVLAESAALPEYESLRQKFLSNTSQRTPKTANWKQAVLLKAWNAWRAEPIACAELWNFVPRGNGMRNPLPGMERDTLEHFAARGPLGITIGMEALLKRFHYNALLCNYIKEQNAEYAFETILDVAACNRNYVSPELLASFGVDRAPEIAAAIPTAARGRVHFLVLALKLLNYRAGAPILGDCLLKIPKGHFGLIDENEYWDEEQYVGLAIAETLEHFADVKFYGHDRHSYAMTRRESSRRIDDAKLWWRKSGRRRKWN